MKKKILIVDDEDTLRKGYKNYFERHLRDECDFFQASNEDEAFLLIDSNEFDVIVTDLRMKVASSGILVLKYAKKKDPSVCVIIVTAYPTDLNKNQAYELGVYDCITKAQPDQETEIYVKEMLYKIRNAIYVRDTLKRLLEHELKLHYFRRYFDPEVFERIIQDPNLLVPSNKLITIIFCDIRGFSSLSDKLKAKTDIVAGFLTEFLEEVSLVIFDNKGVLDKFLGDGILALFGTFNNHEDAKGSAVDAVNCAMQMQLKFSQVYNKWKLEFEKHTADKIDIGLGCGIHTGEALVGNLGTEKRDHFTAIGAHVNLAARIESTAKKSEIRISQTTKAYIGNTFNTTKIDTLQAIKNIPGEYDIFTIG
ncbi:MAG: adenylate/guanylate cyclase domain-containing response regulator [Chitinophagales bacterium]|nr:adenylate/guanylate cyclase domain-containing response regulator [Chitinophagales bacterium]